MISFVYVEWYLKECLQTLQIIISVIATVFFMNFTTIEFCMIMYIDTIQLYLVIGTLGYFKLTLDVQMMECPMIYQGIWKVKRESGKLKNKQNE